MTRLHPVPFRQEIPQPSGVDTTATPILAGRATVEIKLRLLIRYSMRRGLSAEIDNADVLAVFDQYAEGQKHQHLRQSFVFREGGNVGRSSQKNAKR